MAEDCATLLNQDNCLNIGGGAPSIRWALDTESGLSDTHCLLIPDKVYYVNVIHANNPNNQFEQSTCGFDNCGVLFRYTEDDN